MIFRTKLNSKSLYLVQAIIRAEELDVKFNAKVDALGDTVIEATGSKEDIRILKEIYEMVGGETA